MQGGVPTPLLGDAFANDLLKTAAPRKALPPRREYQSSNRPASRLSRGVSLTTMPIEIYLSDHCRVYNRALLCGYEKSS